MPERGRRIAIIGEAMVEMSHLDAETARLGQAGDTMNTAVYLARMGGDVEYFTALGTGDPYSDAILSRLSREGVGTRHVLRHPTRLPGLYAIKTDENGERQFFYWRGQSAAKDMFAVDGVEAALDRAASAGWLYVSGITLSIFDDAGRDRLVELAGAVRSGGGEVVFDPNYRPRGWASREAAQAAFADFGQHVTLALPTWDDENMLYGNAPVERHVARWQGWGVETVVMKCGADGAHVAVKGKEIFVVPVPEAIKPKDTTGAGDSFNGAYLACASQGEDVRECVMAGHRLAARVIQHPGAIIPLEAMPG